MSNFRVGQRVVCVNAGAVDDAVSGHWDDASEAPVEGRVYTVLRSYTFKGRPCVWLEEIKRGSRAQLIHGRDVGYHAHRFRPVVTRKTNISLFKRILANPHVRIEEDA